MNPLPCLFGLVAALTVTASPLNPTRAADLKLVDFEDSQAIRLAPNQARAAIVKAGDGSALDVTTEAAADYPNVRIEPRAGKWDLTGYDFVAVDVRNPQDAPI